MTVVPACPVARCLQQDKYVFPPAGAGGRLATPSHKLNKTFKFRDYAPKVFKKLRAIFGIDEVSERASRINDRSPLPFYAPVFWRK